MFQHTLYSTRHDHDSPEDDYQRRLTSQPSVLQTFLIPPIWQNTGLAAAFHQCPDPQSCFVASHITEWHLDNLEVKCEEKMPFSLLK